MTAQHRPDNHVIVLFGATGDLAKRKLLPGLFHLAAAGLMPREYRIIGSAPAEGAPSDDEFREHVRDALATFCRTQPTGEAWETFIGNVSFASADPDRLEPLVHAVQQAESDIGGGARRLYHLAVPPVAFTSVITMLGSDGLAENARVIIEKPFGTDLVSARQLNATIHTVFSEDRVFRIDHFLGKESVDNILAFRFANGLFEPVWNREHIAYVQVDVPETLSIEGRASFFEKTGTFRDMVVTHLLQVLGFVAMEPPISITAKELRAGKTQVFEAIKPIDPTRVVRGQYAGYRQEPGVAPDSDTETFVALKVEIDNWRWAGVPFYLRTGKSLKESRQLVTIGFREPTLRMFPVEATAGEDIRHNELVIDFADPGSISAFFLAKEPGPRMRLGQACMTFNYDTSFATVNQLEGYERLILEAMLGDQSLFTDADGIERLWEVSTPLLDHPRPVEPYEPGTWGPEAADALILPHHWEAERKIGAAS